MKKIALFLLIVVVFVLCVACGDKEKYLKNDPERDLNEEIFDIIIPPSYMKYSGVEASELCDSFNKMGKEFIYSAEVVESGVKICVTQQQIDKIIERNNKNTKNFIESFESYNKEYCFVGTNDYSVMEFYCDEQLDNQRLFTALATISTTYGMNNILYNKSSEWDVTIRIINCHTDKVVIEGSVLNDTMTIDDKTWEKTYAN